MDNADETVTYFDMSINGTAEKLHNLLSVSVWIQVQLSQIPRLHKTTCQYM
jgi:hypothetical protein